MSYPSSAASIAQHLGTVTLSPDTPVVAGSVGTWTLTLTVGDMGIDEGGTIKLCHRFASDWQAPQFTDPAGPGYATVRTNGQAAVRPSYVAKGHDRPWMKALVIDVYDGSLKPGDTVTIVLGERSGGSPGVRAQTFIESAHVFQVFVDPTNACVARPTPSPHVPIISGPAEQLVCQLPAQALVGQTIKPLLKGEDRWRNPTPAPTDVQLQWRGEGSVDIADGQLVVRDPGAGWLEASAGALRCRSNWMTLHAAAPALQRYWGDLHGQSDSTVGTGSEDEYFRFARDWAGCDFACHQGNDFQLDDAAWQRINDATRKFHQPGVYVTLPGYEWSGNTPAGGDRNVIYDREDQPIFRSSHWQTPTTPATEQTPAHPVNVLFDRLKQHGHALTCAHVGGRYADIRAYFDPDICPLVEVVSCWGVFEWLLWDAIDCGYIVGVMANSDGHKGRPGAEGPGAGEFGIANGLTCILAPELSRPALFAALQQRRCYGTTGARIDLDFSLGEHPMGSVLRAAPSAPVRFAVHGTAPLDRVELYRGRKLLRTWRPAAFDGQPSPRVRVSWSGSRMRGRGRRVRWDGSIRTEGVNIVSAQTFAFDSPADGIVSAEPQRVQFRSQTTGDTDGIDLLLEHAGGGTLLFESTQGQWRVDLAQLAGAGQQTVFDLGEMDRVLRVERYPAQLTQDVLTGEYPAPGEAGKLTPYFVKAVQCDGEMAWSSPIYVDLR